MSDSNFDRGWDDAGGLESRVKSARGQFRRRFIISKIIYLIIVIAGAVIGYQFIPKDVKDAVRNAYFNPDYDPLAEPNSTTRAE